MHSFSCSAAWNFLAECLSVGGVYGGVAKQSSVPFLGKNGIDARKVFKQ